MLNDTAKIPGGLCCGQSVMETSNLELAIDDCSYNTSVCSANNSTQAGGGSLPAPAAPATATANAVNVPVSWAHFHSSSSRALPALSSAVLPAVQAMTSLTLSPGSPAIVTAALAQAATAATASPPAPAVPVDSAVPTPARAPAASAASVTTQSNIPDKFATPEAPAAPTEPGYYCSVCSQSWLWKDTAKISSGLCCGQSVVETENLEVAIYGCFYSKTSSSRIRSIEYMCCANELDSVVASSNSAAASNSFDKLASVAFTSDEQSTKMLGTPAEQARSEQNNNLKKEEQEEEWTLIAANGIYIDQNCIYDIATEAGIATPAGSAERPAVAASSRDEADAHSNLNVPENSIVADLRTQVMRFEALSFALQQRS